MAASATGDAVYVEGRDDEHVIGQLLIRGGAEVGGLPGGADMGSDHADQVAVTWPVTMYRCG